MPRDVRGGHFNEEILMDSRFKMVATFRKKKKVFVVHQIAPSFQQDDTTLTIEHLLGNQHGFETCIWLHEFLVDTCSLLLGSQWLHDVSSWPMALSLVLY